MSNIPIKAAVQIQLLANGTINFGMAGNEIDVYGLLEMARKQASAEFEKMKKPGVVAAPAGMKFPEPGKNGLR